MKYLILGSTRALDESHWLQYCHGAKFAYSGLKKENEEEKTEEEKKEKMD